ncbi:MAG: hypothetical protein QXH37_04840 [Candidatus Bathyarchaeia archaeon]
MVKNLRRKFTENQKRVSITGIKAEKIAKKWLEKRGFNVIEAFSRPHSGHYDIKASKDGEKWIIEVKTGKKPPLNIANFLKMINEKGFHKIGLALVVSKDKVYLLEIKKTKIAAIKAWNTRRKTNREHLD